MKILQVRELIIIMKDKKELTRRQCSTTMDIHGSLETRCPEGVKRVFVWLATPEYLYMYKVGQCHRQARHSMKSVPAKNISGKA